jgi:hypothetical protein
MTKTPAPYPRNAVFPLSSEQASAAGRKGGAVTAAMRRAERAPFQGTVLDVAAAAGMTGPSWAGARAILKAAYALPMDPDEQAFFTAHTNRQTPPEAPVSEGAVVAGRRGGKSRLAAVVGFYSALRFDPARLAPGELAVVPIISADRKQSRVVFSYLRALCALPQFRPWVFRVLKEGIELRTGVNAEVSTASYRTIRGYTVVTAVCDELAFWKDESTSNNPDSEILDALRPGMATVPGALLFACSSPYARKGELFRMHDRYFGQDDPHVLVVNASTAALNPTVAPHILERAFAEDPVAAASEYGHDGRVTFRHDVEAFLDPAAVQAVTMPGRLELPRVAGVRYFGFVDPSGGSQDSFTLAVAHRDGDRATLDVLRERRPPFSPDAVVAEYATLLRTYGITQVVGDRYAGEFARELFAKHGIRYEPSARTKSELYRELVAPINAGRFELLDHPTLRFQLLALERRVSRGGKDSIDHPPGGQRDDLANVCAGVLGLVLPPAPRRMVRILSGPLDPPRDGRVQVGAGGAGLATALFG